MARLLTLNGWRTRFSRSATSGWHTRVAHPQARPARRPWRRCASRSGWESARSSACSGSAAPAPGIRYRPRPPPRSPCFGARRRKDSSSAAVSMVPVGLFGLAMNTTWVSGRIAAQHRLEIVAVILRRHDDARARRAPASPAGRRRTRAANRRPSSPARETPCPPARARRSSRCRARSAACARRGAATSACVRSKPSGIASQFRQRRLDRCAAPSAKFRADSRSRRA